MSLPFRDYETSRLAYEIERQDLGLSGGNKINMQQLLGIQLYEFLQTELGDCLILNSLQMKRWLVDELESSMVLIFTGRSQLFCCYY